jgi:signal transduction histidine kinase
MRSSTEAALLEKIEELSLLRALNDRLAHAPDFSAACRALAALVWEERRAEAVAYVSVDVQRRLCRVEAVAPASQACEPGPELGLDDELVAVLLAESDPTVLSLDAAPAWLGPTTAGGVLVGARTQVRGTTTGLLLLYTPREVASVEEDRRLLAIVAASAALALDAARSQAREEFLATLRHDINDPIAVALGYTEMIVDRLQAGEDRKSTTLALSVGELLKVIADLVSNYLHMAAIDRGGPSLHLEMVELHELVAEIVEQLSPSAREKGISMASEGAAPAVSADRRQLRRVVANLVGNAVKYTPGPGRIVVGLASTRGDVTLSVADDGYGIAAADLPRLFTKYVRLHRDKGVPGTGLGLYISRAIVEAHGGAIAVESAPGRGSTFTVSLPRARR